MPQHTKKPVLFQATQVFMKKFDYFMGLMIRPSP